MLPEQVNEAGYNEGLPEEENCMMSETPGRPEEEKTAMSMNICTNDGMLNQGFLEGRLAWPSRWRT